MEKKELIDLVYRLSEELRSIGIPISKDIEDIRKCIDKLYKVNQRVAKRVNKKRK